MATYKTRLRRVTIIYWVLLLYIFAALIWWFLVLEQQNRQMYRLKKATIEHLRPGPAYQKQLFAIEDTRRRNSAKYLGEGLTFLLLIIIGAVFIYRAVRRQFRLQQQQQNFIMAITHELKTPLAVARLNLETLQKHQLDEAKRLRLLKTTLQETLRLDTLINNILLSSQLEGHQYKLAKEALDFSQLVADILQQFATRYPDRPLPANLQPGVIVEGDPLLLKLLVSNLLENAHKYSPREQPIAVTLQQTAAGIALSFADRGPGIPDDEKKRVFEKFYRLGNEQTRRATGTGLGLHLCRIIAHDHHAGVRVTDNPGGGSIFIVQFRTAKFLQHGSNPQALHPAGRG